MTEQLALEQRLGDGAAVDRDEAAAAARRRVVDRARDELLAGAGLADEEHGGGRLRGLVEQAEHLLHDRARADHRPEPVAVADLGAERLVLTLEDLVGRLQLAHQPGVLAKELCVSAPAAGTSPSRAARRSAARGSPTAW